MNTIMTQPEVVLPPSSAPPRGEIGEIAIRVSGLSFRYGTHPLFENFSLSFQSQKITALLGPNGSGKSTLLRLLSTFVPPPPGTVSIFGFDAAQELARVRPLLGVVFQSPSLDKRLTVEENLRYQGYLYGLRGTALRRRMDAVLEIMELGSRRRDQVATLSGGLQRRVEIAKALLHQPKLLLLDEPTTGLDLPSRRNFMEHLRALSTHEHLTVVIATHLLDEGELCDDVAILARGRVVAQGAPHELIAQVGGHVLCIATTQPEQLRAHIRARYGLDPVLMEDCLRLELPASWNGRSSQILVELIENNPGAVTRVTLAQPTLEDVFIHATGFRPPASPSQAGGSQ
jgi:ABC-2 type transport system ATP-binding protein